jgi:hypothetical protein
MPELTSRLEKSVIILKGLISTINKAIKLIFANHKLTQLKLQVGWVWNNMVVIPLLNRKKQFEQAWIPYESQLREEKQQKLFEDLLQARHQSPCIENVLDSTFPYEDLW